jgi:hypothetical protein
MLWTKCPFLYILALPMNSIAHMGDSSLCRIQGVMFYGLLPMKVKVNMVIEYIPLQLKIHARALSQSLSG